MQERTETSPCPSCPTPKTRHLCFLCGRSGVVRTEVAALFALLRMSHTPAGVAVEMHKFHKEMLDPEWVEYVDRPVDP